MVDLPLSCQFPGVYVMCHFFFCWCVLTTQHLLKFTWFTFFSKNLSGHDLDPKRLVAQLLIFQDHCLGQYFWCARTRSRSSTCSGHIYTQHGRYNSLQLHVTLARILLGDSKSHVDEKQILYNKSYYTLVN